MREYEFRSWDKKTKQMGRLCGFYPSVMQYTGIKDKNGKEIYEGDVVKYRGTNGKHQIVFGHHTIGELSVDDYPTKEYKTPCFAIKWDDDSGYTGLDDSNKIEIVGNIHENPELLNNQ